MATITLIGSGKAATALGKALYAGGHQIIQVWSSTPANASKLASILHAESITDLSQVNGKADVYIIAVKDDAVEDVAKQLHVGSKMIAHTSGIKSRELLKTAGSNYGIFYPFVSMTKETEVDFKKALIMVEGNNEKTASELQTLAQSISDNVKLVEEDQRQALHLAAVFANNFTNHMYAIAEMILKERGLSFNDMRPLIEAHIASVLVHSPSQLQTGPAVRGDESTIDVHKSLLEGHEDLKKIYSLLTTSIQNFQKGGE